MSSNSAKEIHCVPCLLGGKGRPKEVDRVQIDDETTGHTSFICMFCRHHNMSPVIGPKSLKLELRPVYNTVDFDEIGFSHNPTGVVITGCEFTPE